MSKKENKEDRIKIVLTDKIDIKEK